MGSSEGNNINIVIYSKSDLQANTALNNTIVDVINACFHKHVAFRGKLRFEDPSELADELGSDGLCAVAYLQDDILGSASIRQWRPTAGGVVDKALHEQPAELKLVEAGLSYEAKAIVTVDSPLSRGKGLAGTMIQALVEKVQQRHPGDELLLWLQLGEEQNGAYWRRRGYERVGAVEIKPKGTWGSTHDFEFCTMVKHIPSA